jgi:hypothetical protein
VFFERCQLPVVSVVDNCIVILRAIRHQDAVMLQSLWTWT